MNESLRATRLAQEFEGYVDARRTKQRGLDPELIHSLTVAEPIGAVEHSLTTTQLEDAAKLLRERGEGLTLDRRQRLALQDALTSMPFSASVDVKLPRISDDDYIAGVTRALRDLAAAVTVANLKAELVAAQLRELQSQRDAVRAFFGTDGES